MAKATHEGANKWREVSHEIKVKYHEYKGKREESAELRRKKKATAKSQGGSEVWIGGFKMPKALRRTINKRRFTRRARASAAAAEAAEMAEVSRHAEVNI